MKRNTAVKGTIALCTAALIAPTAFADVGSLHQSMRGPSVDVLPNFGDRDIEPGDTFASAVGVFGAGGGALLYDGTPGPFAFGGTSSMGTNGISAGTGSITSSVTDLGNGQQQIVIEWFEDGGTPMLPQGGTLGGSPVTTISFEIDSANTGPDGINPLGNFEFKHLEDTPGVFLAGFELLDTLGNDLFGGTGSFFVNADGGDIGGVTFISAGANDLGNFGIAGGRATIVITKVPAPGALALLGIAGVIGSRRRRS